MERIPTMSSDDWTLPESEIQQQIARAAIARAHKGEDMAKEKGGVIRQINEGIAANEAKKQSGVAVQQELIEDARQAKKLPAKLRNKLAPLCEAEELAGTNRLRATELLGEIQEMMAALEIPQIALPNGGKVIYTEKKSARYVAPKKTKIAEADEDTEDSEDNDE